MLPLFVPLALIAPLAGRVIARTGPRRPMVAGLLLTGAGFALLARVGPGSGYPTLLPALLAWGTGNAVLAPSVVTAAMGAVEPARAGLASGVNNTMRQAGGVVGVALTGAVVGSPTQPAAFLPGMHAAALGAATCVGAAAAAVLLTRPASTP